MLNDASIHMCIVYATPACMLMHILILNYNFVNLQYTVTRDFKTV